MVKVPSLHGGVREMAISTRRDFILCAAAVSVDCAARGTESQAPIGAAARTARPPVVGQSWRYAKHDYFTGKVVDTQVDRVSNIDKSVQIESQSETVADKPITYPSWGDRWWQEHMGNEAAVAPAPTEVQIPWGMIVIDPHWSELQAFEKAIPLWPTQLRPGWSTVVSTYYKIPGSEESMPWQLTMHAQRWESVAVPAGRFIALRYHNFIDFRFSIFAERTAAQRREHLWFAPEIGRWVIRESVGTFHEQLATEVKESSYRWELLSWT
jgi:hypothetical protein